MQVLGPDGTGSTEGILKAMDAVAEVVKKGKRADAPRQLLRVSRPSTTTSPLPGGTAALMALRSRPPPSRCCRASRAQVPSPVSSFGVLLHSSVSRNGAALC